MKIKSEPTLKQKKLCDLLTREDIARAEQVSLRTIDRRIQSGDLPTLKLGRSVRIHPDDYQAFLEKQRSAITEAPKVTAHASKGQETK